MPRPQWAVKRMHGGEWQWFAGTNVGIGAPRWSMDPRDASRFPSRKRALTVAQQHGAFVTRWPQPSTSRQGA